MDNYTASNGYRIIEQLNEKKKDLKAQYTKTRNIIIVVVLLIVGIISYFIYQSNTSFLFFIPLVVGLIIVLISFIATELSLRNKLVKTYFNSEVMNAYNMEHEVNYSYLASPKIPNDFNKEMGLFTRYASVTTNYQIEGNIEGVPFDLRHHQLVVSTGNSSQVVFDGIYLILPISGEKIFQLRVNGKPALKKTKFVKEQKEDKRIFLLEEDNGNVKDKYIRTFDMLKNEFNCNKVYIASNEKEVHIAFAFKIKPKYPKEITTDSFALYYEQFTKTFKALNQIMTKTSEVY